MTALNTTPNAHFRPPGVGIVRNGMRRILIQFDEDMFAAIRERAEKERTSFAEQVRLLVEWGLEA